MSAQAFDPAAMSEAEKEAFGAAVRSYLLEHPEVLSDMVAALEEQEALAQAETDRTIVATNAEAIFSDGFSFVGGNPEGDLTVVEFIDYRCGYCRKAHSDVAELVRSDGNIRYIVKEFPILGEQSVLASRFAISTLLGAGPEAYARVNAGFYESFRGDVTEDTLRSFAAELGLDGEAILAGMDAPEVTRIIEENHRLAERLSISGTPTFVIGEQMMRGYAPLDHMRGLVDEARG
jgi:protein-disulfide isomerase